MVPHPFNNNNSPSDEPENSGGLIETYSEGRVIVMYSEGQVIDNS